MTGSCGEACGGGGETCVIWQTTLGIATSWLQPRHLFGAERSDGLHLKVPCSGSRYAVDLRGCIAALKTRFNVTLIADHCCLEVLEDSEEVEGKRLHAATPLEAALEKSTAGDRHLATGLGGLQQEKTAGVWST